MSFLGRFRVLTKVLGVVFVLSCVAIGIAVLGITSLNQIGEQSSLRGKDRERSAAAVRA